MENQNDLLVGLDVGSSQIRCVVARRGEHEDSYHLVGFGTSDSAGIRRGCVVDIEEAVGSIRSAIANAADSSEVKIERVWAAIGGGMLDSRQCSGVAALKGREVSRDDVETANRNAQANALGEQKSRDLIKIIPQGYACGDVDFVKNPVGLEGETLTCLVQAVYGSASNAENMRKCMQRAGIEVVNYEPHPWAAAIGVLTPTERRCGVAVIDIGAETTSICVFKDDFLRFTAVRAWGASHLTRDLSMVLGMDWDEAEYMKCNSGICDASGILDSDVVQSYKTSKRCLKKLLVKTLEARARELLTLDKKIIEDAGELENVHKVVLTGGGVRLAGMKEVAESVFQGVPCSIGTPVGVENECQLKVQPDMSVVWGLIRCAGGGGQGLEEPGRPSRFSHILGKLKVAFLGEY